MMSSLVVADHEKVKTHEVTLNYMQLKMMRLYEGKFSVAVARKDRLMGP